MPALLLAITVGFYWRLVLNDQYTWLDSPDPAFQVLPWFQFQAGEWHHGRFPLWDPYHWGGQPLIGQTQPGAAYPLNWILFSLPLRDGWMRQEFLHWYYVLLHYLAASFFYLLCRYMGRSRPASVLGSCVFAFGGLVASIVWPQMLNGAIWMPLVFLFLLRSVDGVRPTASACLGGMFLGIAWLGGHHQVQLFVTLAAGLSWLYFILRDRRIDWTIAGLTSLFFLFAALTSGLQTLPSYEYGKLAHRWIGLADPVDWQQKVPYFIHGQYSLNPASLLGILFPFAGGHIEQFMGVIAMALSAIGAAGYFVQRNIRLALCLCFLGLFLALGAATPIHGVLYALVPMIEKARSPFMATIIFNFGIAILSSAGLDYLRTGKLPNLLRVAALSLAIFAAFIFIALSLLSFLAPKAFNENFFVTAFLAACAAGALYSYSKALISFTASFSLLILLLLCELSLGHVSILPNRLQPADTYFLRKLSQDHEIARFLYSRPVPFRVAKDNQEIEYNFGDWYGIESTGGYLASITSNLVPHETHSRRTQDLLGVAYYIGREPRWDDEQLVHEARNGLKVFRNRNAFPRTWTVHQLVPIQHELEVPAFINNKENDLRINAPMIGALPALEKCSGKEAVSVLRSHPGFIHLRADMQCRGMLVVSETYFPGWHATADGNPVQIYQPYGAFRGVVLERGIHEVKMRYRPASVFIGAFMTFAGIFGAALIQALSVKAVEPGSHR